MSATPAAAGYAPDHVNVWITTFPTDTLCVESRDALNAASGYPNSRDEYHYCGGSGHNALWFRRANY
ncbi:hypothetical protein [Actinacidiphila sp. bgisy167]|uniref:hypothetical protein n=1 Tax=Actinacidiphila sp. bgisy167 TaxID=3413797 RepID=UPI003D73FD8F